MQLKLENLTDRLTLVEFSSREALAYAFVRIQEHFESPQFKGRSFTLEEFIAWYTANSPNGQKTGKFTYATDWDAFNLPARAFRPFQSGEFDPLSQREQSLLKILKAWVDDGVYVIATWKNGSEHDLRHEVAHGLFNTDRNYKRAVLRALAHLSKEQRAGLQNFLGSTAGYHKETYLDEMHAYLIAGHADLRKAGVGIEQYAGVISQLRQIFNKTVEASPKLTKFKIE